MPIVYVCVWERSNMCGGMWWIVVSSGGPLCGRMLKFLYIHMYVYVSNGRWQTGNAMRSSPTDFCLATFLFFFAIAHLYAALVGFRFQALRMTAVSHVRSNAKTTAIRLTVREWVSDFLCCWKQAQIAAS